MGAAIWKGPGKKLRAAFELFAAPHEFRLPRHVEGGWIIGGYHFAENPLFTTPGWAVTMVERWAEARRMEGQLPGSPRILPRGGGYLDQPALLMDAWPMFDRWMLERKADP